jgi:predicted Holliday junction resolvase-like endonuclease
MAEILSVLIIIGFVVFALILIWLSFKIGVKSGKSEKELEWQSNLVRLRGDIANRQRVGIKGKVAETFAPFLKGFPFKASECKFIGDPIDYLVFEGLDERDIKGVRLVEVKSDTSKLSKHQKQIKDILDSVDDDRVSFHTFGFKSESEK